MKKVLAMMAVGWVVGCSEAERESGKSEGEDRPGPRPAGAGRSGSPGLEGERLPVDASGKLAVRPEDPGRREVPIADRADLTNDLPGMRGMVISPHSGKVIDVRNLPAGTLVSDPTYPASEKKYFRVPEFPEAEDEIPVAQRVPGKSQFVFSPFTNKIIDVGGLEAGQRVSDPTLPSDAEAREFRVPPEAEDSAED